ELQVDNEYIMSAADLCTIDVLDQVLDSGATVFKIEGRGRSSDYVYTVVESYRKAFDALLDGTYTREEALVWKEQLKTVFNRGFWEGYYLGRTMGEWSDVHGSKATKKKKFLGPCKKYYSNRGIGAFLIQTGQVSEGDELLVTGPTTGALTFRAEELRLDDERVKQVDKGGLFSTPVPEKVRPSDKLYKLEAVVR
ncbi:U32 family peptidase, partial [Balneolaceae bacterium ANBcel3]|nr:U32 family peptidase [Balneolaceae bacterium ANBcel3]